MRFQSCVYLIYNVVMVTDVLYIEGEMIWGYILLIIIHHLITFYTYDDTEYNDRALKSDVIP